MMGWRSPAAKVGPAPLAGCANSADFGRRISAGIGRSDCVTTPP